MKQVGSASKAHWAWRAAIVAVADRRRLWRRRFRTCDQRGAAAPPAVTKPVYGSFGVDLTARKTAVKPGDDFFANVNGTWLDDVPHPG